MADMPNPTQQEHDSNLFEAVWRVIKSWDVNVPEFYEGYCGANGSHVKLILDGLREATKDSNLVAHATEQLRAMGADLDDFPNAQLLDLIRVFALSGHSGSSAEWTIHMFSKLASFEPVGEAAL